MVAWFSGFKRRYKISLRRPTNTAQNSPKDKEAAIMNFHRQIREIQLGDGKGDGPLEERFGLNAIANVDQTPLPFSFTKGQTYETTNSSTVWVRGGQSGLDKRQCTIQLTIFADWEPRVKPFIIFRGKGKRISMKERLQYDKKVMVHFQENAWCDEQAMEYWAKYCWKPKVKEPMLLVLDLHKAQKTDHIQELLTEGCDTTPAFIPAGLTNILQPLDVSYNAPFKERVESTAAQHMEENLNKYLNGKFTAGERRVLLTKWVGDAWEELSGKKEIAVRAFKKCGISTAADLSDEGDPFADASDEGDPFADLSDDGSFIEDSDQEIDD